MSDENPYDEITPPQPEEVVSAEQLYENLTREQDAAAEVEAPDEPARRVRPEALTEGCFVCADCYRDPCTGISAYEHPGEEYGGLSEDLEPLCQGCVAVRVQALKDAEPIATPELEVDFPARHIKAFAFPADMLAMLRPNTVFYVKSNPIPEGARCVGLQYNASLHLHLAIFEHESFEPVGFREQVPLSDEPCPVLTTAPKLELTPVQAEGADEKMREILKAKAPERTERLNEAARPRRQNWKKRGRR